MDIDRLTGSPNPQEEAAAERFRPVPGQEEELEETEALKRDPTHEEIFRPHEPGPHPRP